MARLEAIGSCHSNESWITASYTICTGLFPIIIALEVPIEISMKVPNIKFQLPCKFWQHTVPNTYIEDLTSHLHAIIRAHHFCFNIRFQPFTDLMLKIIHQSQIWHWVLSEIYANDHNYRPRNSVTRSTKIILQKFEKKEKIWWARQDIG